MKQRSVDLDVKTVRVAAVVSVGNRGLTCNAKGQNELAGAPEYSLNRVQLTSTTAIQAADLLDLWPSVTNNWYAILSTASGYAADACSTRTQNSSKRRARVRATPSLSHSSSSSRAAPKRIDIAA